MGELRDRTQGALDSGALALFGIAFLAMFRESFETAVFLEALSIDAPTAVVWGASRRRPRCSLGLVYAMGRAGVRLPMQKLFDVSTVVLLATAVVLLGQGIHSFEEVGLLPSRPMPFFRDRVPRHLPRSPRASSRRRRSPSSRSRGNGWGGAVPRRG